MAVSMTIPTPPGAGQPVSIRVGKVTREWPSAAAALDWAQSQAPDLDTLFAIAIRLANARPATRGKTLTFDPAAAANLMVIS